MTEVNYLESLDVFSGCGGLALAFENAGFSHMALCEIDPVCRKVLRKHFPGVEIIDDVKKISKETVKGNPAVLVGGSPCQDFSVAGLRKGLDGDRSGLWFEYLRIAAEYLPRWIVFENVPGLISSWTTVEPPPCQMEVRDFDTESEAQRWADSMARDWTVEEGSDLETILSGLAELGYCVAFRIFDAQYFGLPQRRARVCLVASLRNGGSAEVLFERSGGAWDPPPSRQTGERVAALTANGVGTCGADDNQSQAGHLIPEIAQTVTAGYADNGGASAGANGQPVNLIAAFGGNNTSGPIEVATACNAHGGTGWMDFESETFITQEVTGSLLAKMQRGVTGQDAYNDMLVAVPEVAGTLAASGAGSSRPAGQENELDFLVAHTLRGEGFDPVPDPIVIKGAAIGRQPENGGEHLDDGSCYTLTTNEVHAVAFTERTRSNGREVEISEDLAYSLTDGSKGGNPHSGKIAGGFGVRRLTPRECEKLQGMPPDWTRWGDDGKEIADSPRYRMIGNSVAVPVFEWIARRIMQLEKGETPS